MLSATRAVGPDTSQSPIASERPDEFYSLHRRSQFRFCSGAPCSVDAAVIGLRLAEGFCQGRARRLAGGATMSGRTDRLRLFLEYRLARLMTLAGCMLPLRRSLITTRLYVVSVVNKSWPRQFKVQEVKVFKYSYLVHSNYYLITTFVGKKTQLYS